MQNKTYQYMKEFKHKYPTTVAWRLKKHAKVIEKHLNDGEVVTYAFPAQKNDNPLDIVTTYAIVLTNKRLLLATKRLLWGYFFTSITPDMFNDLKVETRLLWGRVYIDTIKEYVTLSNISKNALPEIETKITDFMIREKRRMAIRQKVD